MLLSMCSSVHSILWVLSIFRATFISWIKIPMILLRIIQRSIWTETETVILLRM